MVNALLSNVFLPNYFSSNNRRRQEYIVRNRSCIPTTSEQVMSASKRHSILSYENRVPTSSCDSRNRMILKTSQPSRRPGWKADKILLTFTHGMARSIPTLSTLIRAPHIDISIIFAKVSYPIFKIKRTETSKEGKVYENVKEIGKKEKGTACKKKFFFFFGILFINPILS